MPTANRSLPAKYALGALAVAYAVSVLLLSISLSANCAEPAGGTYTVVFPPRAKLAELTIAVPYEFAPGGKEMRLGAQGRITLPKTCTISLNLHYDGLENISYLEQLDENQVHRISAAKLELDDGQFAHLKKFKHIITLNLDDTTITDKSMPIIGTFTNLSMLRLSGTDITGSGFAALDNLHHLWSLNIAGINLKPGSLSHLKAIGPSLCDLTCSRTNLTPADLQSIGQVTTLTSLLIDGNKQIGNDCLKYLLPLKHLQTLHIEDTAINEKCLPDLYKLPALRAVTIRNHQFWTGGIAQKTKPGITFVDGETKNRIPLETFSPLH